jgi:hypothetical protein
MEGAVGTRSQVTLGSWGEPGAAGHHNPKDQGGTVGRAAGDRKARKRNRRGEEEECAGMCGLSRCACVCGGGGGEPGGGTTSTAAGGPGPERGHSPGRDSQCPTSYAHPMPAPAEPAPLPPTAARRLAVAAPSAVGVEYAPGPGTSGPALCPNRSAKDRKGDSKLGLGGAATIGGGLYRPGPGKKDAGRPGVLAGHRREEVLGGGGGGVAIV